MPTATTAQPIDTALLDAIIASDAPPETLHLDVGKRTGRLGHNVKRTMGLYVEAGHLDPDTFKPTPSLLQTLRGLTGDLPATAAAKLAAPPPGAITQLPHDRLTPSGLNYRRTFDEEGLESLAASLLAKGQLQSILCRPHPETAGHYQVVAGERRWRAFALLIERGHLPPDTPVDVKIRDLDDRQALGAALGENREQKTVDPYEEAEGFERYRQFVEATGGETGDVTADIAADLSCSRRIVQRRLRTIRDLIPAAREAWSEGRIPSFAMAEELSRWPEDHQADALEELTSGTYAEITNAAELKDWLENEAPPVGEQPFDEELYCAEGGTFVEPEDEGEPRRFGRKSLAERLTHDWIVEKAAALAEAHGYHPDPVIAPHYWEHNWPKPGKDDTVPDSQKRAFFQISHSTLKVEVIHPVVDAATLRGLRSAASTGGDAGTDATAATAPAREPVKPYARRCWLQGAKARTDAAREEIEQRPAAAMALTILAFLHGDREGAYYNDSAPLFLQKIGTTGDASEIGFGASFEALLNAAPCDGIDLSNRSEPVRSREKAMAALMAREDLPFLFAALIADRTVDCRYSAGPGSEPEIRAIMDGKASDFAMSSDSDWLEAYTIDQLIAHGRASGLWQQEEPASKKSELIEHMHANLLPTWHPPEVRFLKRDAMSAAVDRILAGTALSPIHASAKGAQRDQTSEARSA